MDPNGEPPTDAYYHPFPFEESMQSAVVMLKLLFT